MDEMVPDRIAPLVLASLLAGCGASPGPSASNAHPRADSFGDPYITDSEGREIPIGTLARAAFDDLGGTASSGANGGAISTKAYDYPIRGTGNPDDPNDATTIWWQLCVRDGRIVGKQRGTFDQLPTYC
jgi:hypothetical protein